jgi:hypothetical protein
MADSPSHKFGQIIGDLLEAAILPLLDSVSKKYGLYLDKKGTRPCRKGKTCAWTDLYQNTHDLDFVLERAGTASKRGDPIAFIEVAWRRYTKHSRNKAQEIQGAIEPLAVTYEHHAPFKGAILAGDFTDGAIEQLKSLGFNVLYFPYNTVVSAFARLGIDASFDENTPDKEFQHKLDRWHSLPEDKRAKVPQLFISINQKNVDAFLEALKSSILRKIQRIVIVPLHGKRTELTTIEDAVKLISTYNEQSTASGFVRYEIQIIFNNGNEINGKFNDKSSAVEFLHIYKS